MKINYDAFSHWLSTVEILPPRGQLAMPADILGYPRDGCNWH